MTVEFFLKDTPLETAEAIQLLQATSSAIKKPIRIELTRLIGAKNLNYKKLLDLAIRNNNRELIDIAWKLATTEDSNSNTDKRYASEGFTSGSTPAYLRLAPEPHTVDNLISTLVTYKGSWAGGAALLLRSTANGKWKSLKEIAVDYINSREFSPTSKMLSGFEYDRITDAYVPTAKVGRDTKSGFHGSRIYMSLREGLIWCRAHELAEQKEEVSYGSSKQESAEISKHMQRVFYKVRATEKGAKLAEEWGDIMKFIDGIYDQY